MCRHNSESAFLLGVFHHNSESDTLLNMFRHNSESGLTCEMMNGLSSPGHYYFKKIFCGLMTTTWYCGGSCSVPKLNTLLYSDKYIQVTKCICNCSVTNPFQWQNVYATVQ